MSTTFNNLTFEHIDLIPEHLKKWKIIALYTEKINRKQAEQVVNSFYKMLEYKLPIILFYLVK